KQTDFYRQASDAEADKTARNLAEANRNKKQAVVEKRRKEQKAREHFSFEPKKPLEPGIKDFDADMAQTQLREAAEEFGRGFSGQHFADSIPVRVSLMAVVPGANAREIELAERKQMKAS
ncbi:DUF2235 domain-containing protein, partial [Pseudomonas sp. Bout1]|nr:DUF2235 domain-containing protein [Pseudomonas sp. Bout1]